MKCLVCNSVNNHEIYKLVKGTNYSLLQCKSCGLAWLAPLPGEEDLKKFYSGVYYPSELDNNFVSWRKSKDVSKFKRLIRCIIGYKEKGFLLEIGCSYGFFLQIAKEQGFDAYGVEYALSPAKYAKDKLGLNVVNGGTDQAALFNKKFDVIVLSHVIEHFINPLDEISKLKMLLKDDGIIILKTPNFNSITRIIQRNVWFWLLAPEHIFYFNVKNLLNLFSSSGFDILRVTTSEGDFENVVGVIFYALIAKSKFFSQLKKIFYKEKKKNNTLMDSSYMLFSQYPAIMKLNYIFKILSLLLSPFILISNALNKGSEIFLVASKDSKR